MAPDRTARRRQHRPSDTSPTVGLVAPESASFETFYVAQVNGVTALAYALTGSWAAAEDLAQEAFARALRDWDRVGVFTRADSWVRTVTVNLATSRFRRLSREAKTLSSLGRIREAASAEPFAADVEQFLSAVRSLPRRQAQAAALRYVDDLPLAEIAEVMGCAEGTVKAHLHRARAHLIEQLQLVDEESR